MFEFIRKHLKLVMIIFFPLVILAFVFVGVDASMLTQRSPVVARVAGTDITQNQWDQVHRQMADQARRNNPEVSAQLLDSPEQKYAVLERIVRDEVYRVAMQDKHYLVSDAELARTLQSDPDIAALRSADGRLDVNAYREWVASRYGMTPESFEQGMRYQLGLQQVIGTVQDASITTPRQAVATIDAAYQRREVQLAQFLPAHYTDRVAVTEAQLQAFYQQNTARFQRPEEVDVQYVLLTLDGVAASVDVSEAELRQYYESNRQSYTRRPEQRRVRHILVSTTTDMSTDERDAARQKALGLREQLVQNPGQFAEIAKTQSQDTGSSAAGGDLGLMARGAMVPAFDDALFRLEKDAISEVVATEYGFHIIQVTDIQAADIPAFEEISEQIGKDVRNSQARNQFIEAAEQLRNLAHEQPDSLEPAATALNLPIQTAQGITRNASADTEPSGNIPAALLNPLVLEELFSSKLLEDQYNSEAIDIGNNQIVAARIVQHRPARVLPLEEVQAQNQELFVTQEAARLAREAGAQALQAWQNAPETVAEQLQNPVVVSRLDSQGLDTQTIARIMQIPQDRLPAFEGIEQGSQGYLLVKTNRVVQEAETGAEAQAWMQQLRQADYAQALALAETEAYYETLKQAYKVQIRVPRP